MNEKKITSKVIKIENIGGMAVNERLYATNLDDEFYAALKDDKNKAIKILELLKVDDISIKEIIKNLSQSPL